MQSLYTGKEKNYRTWKPANSLSTPCFLDFIEQVFFSILTFSVVVVAVVVVVLSVVYELFELNERVVAAAGHRCMPRLANEQGH